VSNDQLLNEAALLIEASRIALSQAALALDVAVMEETEKQTTKRRSSIVSIELNAQTIADQYQSGLTVAEVAAANGVTYNKIRTILKANGTPIRNASDRLKGRTRPDKQKAQV
jgi:hypothetical protein